MKKTLTIIIIILSFGKILSQNIEPTQHQFNVNGTSKYLSADSAVFKQDKFMLQWHWGSGTSNMRQKLLMNSTSGSVGFQLDSTSDEQVDLIHEPIWFSRSPYTYYNSVPYYYSEGLFTNLVAFLEYDPRIKITDETLFKPIPNDPKNSIFGFRYNISDLHFSFL